MARFTQEWRCQCGHVARKTVSYPKIGADSRPLARLAQRARCTACGKRGRTTISEHPVPPVRLQRG